MAATARGFYVPTGNSVDLGAKAQALAGEANVQSATVERYTKVLRIDVTASESSGGADDAETQLDNAVAAVGGLMLQPGTSKVLS